MPGLPASPIRSGDVSRPYISVASVRAALEHMVFDPRAQQRPVSPLEHLSLITAALEASAGVEIEQPRAHELGRRLVHWVTAGYQAQRALLGMAAVGGQATLAQALDDLQAAAATENPTLMGWAALYYRFIRDDLHLNYLNMGEHLGFNERTLRRYGDEILLKLTETIRTEEEQARLARKARTLRARLPAEPRTLIGRGALLDGAFGQMTRAPQQLLISGAAGAGKTAFALALADRLIAQDAIDDVIWLDAPHGIDVAGLAVREAMQMRGLLHLPVRDYGQAVRTLVVIDGAAGLDSLNDVDNFLREHDALHILVLDRAANLCPAYTGHIVLASLDKAGALALARHFWRSFDLDKEVIDLEPFVESSGGNPGALVALISHYEKVSDEMLYARSTGVLFAATCADLSGEAQALWAAYLLAPPSGITAANVRRMWQVSDEAQDALLKAHILRALGGWPGKPQTCGLADHALAWMRAEYERGGAAREWVSAAAAALDDHVGAHEAAVLPMVEHSLAQRWLALPPERRTAWIEAGWRQGVRRNRWALWLALLRGETAQAQASAWAWIGRGVCARWLALWDESYQAFSHAIRIAGAQADFVTIGEAMLERSIWLRLRGQYERALNDQTWVLDRARREGAVDLGQRAACELAQIALEREQAAECLRWVEEGGGSVRSRLLGSEAHLLMGQPQRCLDAAQAALLAMEDDPVGQGKTHGLLARGLHAQGKFDEAQAEFETAIQLLAGSGDDYHLARIYSNLGVLLCDRGEYFAALESLTRSLDMQQRLGDPVATYVARQALTLATRRTRG